MCELRSGFLVVNEYIHWEEEFLPADQFAGVSVHDVKLPIAKAILPRAFDLVDALGRLSSATIANADVAGEIELDTFGAEVECKIELTSPYPACRTWPTLLQRKRSTGA